mmetsp:Transcript_61491/g.181723  ORF Transcript_61491/g.181723 Transcript_61491/m.181723 type:complete len:93 (+) Transcript_61491:1441-1719(+)
MGTTLPMDLEHGQTWLVGPSGRSGSTGASCHTTSFLNPVCLSFRLFCLVSFSLNGALISSQCLDLAGDEEVQASSNEMDSATCSVASERSQT